MNDSKPAQQSLPPLQPKVVLAIGAHADDIDFGASATVAKWVAGGAEVHYLIVTDGSKGSSDTDMSVERLVRMRQNEQREAAKFLGVKSVKFLGYEDGMLEITMDLKRDIIRAIREIKPDTVITLDPTMVYSTTTNMLNHPDHRAAGQAVLDAVFPLARDHMSFPELYAEGLQPHKTAHLLMINFDRHNYMEDVTDTFDKKHEALRLHASQFNDQSREWEVTTNLAKHFGTLCGHTYAEAFMRIDLPV